MNVPSRRLRKSAVVALSAVMAIGLTAACSKSDEPSGPAGSNEKITLKVDTFGDFGYDDLYKEYETSHPNIKIEPRPINKLDDYKSKLVQYLAAGTGAGDVVALEEGILNEFKAQPQNFVDLGKYGGNELAGDYLGWKFNQGKTADGKLIALPTDIGGLATCYRRDLFKKAGLPEERDEVSKLWPTWDDFIATGEKFNDAKTKSGFVDSATVPFSAILAQSGDTNFFDTSDKLIADSNPSVKSAWDTSMKMIDKGITAKLATWSDPWTAGFKNGTFAVTLCPSWMLGIIKTNSGESNSGKWDVAAVPGGGGNWGGSFLAVPTVSKHPAEAAELAKFLTSAQGQISAFNKAGPLPSNLKALDDPALLAKKDPYFNDAPVGEIFAKGAKTLKPVYLGPKHQGVKERAFEPAIISVEQGKATPDEAWKNAQKNAVKEAK